MRNVIQELVEFAVDSRCQYDISKRSKSRHCCIFFTEKSCPKCGFNWIQL